MQDAKEKILSLKIAVGCAVAVNTEFFQCLVERNLIRHMAGMAELLGDDLRLKNILYI